VGRKNLPRLIYNMINGLDPPSIPTHILSPLGCDRYCDVGVLLRNLNFGKGFYGKNALILLLHKSWATDTKLNTIGKNDNEFCKFCKNGKHSHIHAISDCAVAKWIFEMGKSRPLWPKSVKDLILVDRNLMRDEVKVRLAILAAISKLPFECVNYQEAIVMIDREVDKLKTSSSSVGGSSDKKSRYGPIFRGKFRFKLFFDGSACPLLRNGGFGYSLRDGNVEIARLSGSLGNATVNDAELFALYMGIKKARELGIDELSVLGDSKFVVKLGTKGAVCLNAKFMTIFLEMQKLIREFKSYDINHIPRSANARADVLAYTGCNAPESIQEVMGNVNCSRPNRTMKRPHSYVIPQVNTSDIWHHRIWNPIPQRVNERFNVDRLKVDGYLGRIVDVYKEHGGVLNL
jgi:ribonuclease HI